jgi:hypothetical protein
MFPFIVAIQQTKASKSRFYKCVMADSDAEALDKASQAFYSPYTVSACPLTMLDEEKYEVLIKPREQSLKDTILDYFPSEVQMCNIMDIIYGQKIDLATIPVSQVYNAINDLVEEGKLKVYTINPLEPVTEFKLYDRYSFDLNKPMTLDDLEAQIEEIEYNDNECTDALKLLRKYLASNGRIDASERVNEIIEAF